MTDLYKNHQYNEQCKNRNHSENLKTDTNHTNQKFRKKTQKKTPQPHKNKPRMATTKKTQQNAQARTHKNEKKKHRTSKKIQKHTKTTQ